MYKQSKDQNNQKKAIQKTIDTKTKTTPQPLLIL